jgi:hypothetical protein
MGQYGDDCGLKRLVGSKILKIYMNEDYLKFETDKGNFVFSVSGDCCSSSVFYDFFGVKKLFGKVVKAIEDVELKAEDIGPSKKYDGCQADKKDDCIDSVEVYGYRIVTEDENLGDVSSVFSFRNYSNGYYGGSLDDCNDREVKPEIFDDVIETEPSKSEEN